MSDYALALAACAGNDHADNYDWRRFGSAPERPATRSWRKRLAAAWRQRLGRGLVPARDVELALWAGLRFVEPHLDDLQWLHDHLDEAESRWLLVQLFCFRALGHRRVKLPLNRPDHWKAIESLEQAAEGAESIDPNFLEWRLSRLDLRGVGYPIELFYRPDAIVANFVHEQYRCQTAEGAIEVREGDVVVDAGGCWADTALYFAFKAGPQGKVFSFEFLPSNLEIYQRNLALNPDLAGRVKLMPHPVWSEEGVELFVTQNGPGSTVTPARRTDADATVRTMKIDQLLDDPDCQRLDFIKMDIEGAELPTLHGAETALRRFRPRLAITVYHSVEDFWAIPQYLDQLGLGYRFYLRHFTTHAEETVLFATCEGQA